MRSNSSHNRGLNRSAGIVRAGDWLDFARRFLEDLPGDRGRSYREESAGSLPAGSAALETQVLLASVLDKPRAWVLAHPEAILAPQQNRQLTGLLARLARGEPLPYLTGQQEFYGLDFAVSPAVLIPRPETELLVEQALIWLRQNPDRRKAADVGTGSGCIAVVLAKQVPDLHILAVDRSSEALALAESNAQHHRVTERINFAHGHLLSAAAGPFDLVCANLPYIPHSTLADLAVARHEPLAALDGGPDGLALIRELVADARRWLAPGGLLLLEMQFDQGEAIHALVHTALPGAQPAVLTDLAGLPRLVRVINAG